VPPIDHRRQSPFRARVFAACTILSILCCVPATAQMDTATLAGRVADSSGAVIVKARVELVDIERNTKSRVQTNNTGLYIFPDIRPGHYRMEVSAPGYKTVALATLTIYVQDDIQQNFRLAVGSPLESVIIEANGTPVETTGAVGTVVEQTLVRELPLNGRSFQTLFQLTPGVVITPTNFASQGQFSVNGQRTNTNYFIVDGASANFAIAAGVNPGQSAGGSLPAVSAFGGTNSLVSTDDVQEFAVLTSSYSAEFGRMPGAQVSIVTRSGTNEFHGHIFEYLRNDAFDANDWFANRDNLKRAALRQNDYGGVFGGPIFKDRTFFFASYEGLRLRQPTSIESDVPSLAARNSAPASMKPFFNAYPLPNGADEGNGLARATYAFSNPSSLDAISLRIDQHGGEFLSMFAHYDHSTSDRNQRGAAINSLSTVTDTRFALQTLTAGLTCRISSKSINDLRFNWSRFSASSHDQLDSFGNAVPLPPELVFPPPFDQENSLFQFLPAAGPQHLRLSFGRNINNTQNQTNIVDNASYQIQTHLLKTGFDVRSLSPEIVPAEYTQASFFADIKSALTGTSLFSAIAATVAVRSNFGNLSAYVQDGWKLQARLNVTYGLRWDYNPAPSGRGANGLQPFAIENVNSLPALSLARPGTPIYHAPSNNFAPRLGFAYEIRRSSGTESVIRVGAGMFYDLGNGPAGNAFAGTSFPFSAQKLLVAAPFPLSSGDGSPPLIATAPPFRTIVAFPSLLKLPYTWQWNIALQQTLGNEQTLTVSYVGASGHSLLRTEEYVGGMAGVPEAFTQLLFTNNAGYSNYNSLQLRFQRRARRGVNIIASYTFSHSLDNVSTDAVFGGIPRRFLNPRVDYGSSDFDIRHTATMGLDYTSAIASTSHVLRGLLSNWSVDAIEMNRSSPPIDALVSRDIGFGTYEFRPDLIEGTPKYLYGGAAPGGRRLNPSALSVPTAQRQGDLERNFFRGFPLFQTDLAIRRLFRMTQRTSIQVRSEVFNLFNHPNFSPQVGQLGRVDTSGKFLRQTGFGISPAVLGQGLQSGTFGAGFSPLYQIGAARSLQFALKVEF
jgi:hypothetical protein